MMMMTLKRWRRCLFIFLRARRRSSLLCRLAVNQVCCRAWLAVNRLLGLVVNSSLTKPFALQNITCQLLGWVGGQQFPYQALCAAKCKAKLAVVRFGQRIESHRFTHAVFCHCLGFGAVRQWQMDGFTKLFRVLVQADGNRWVALLSSLHCKTRELRLAWVVFGTAWSCSQTLTDGWQMGGR